MKKSRVCLALLLLSVPALTACGGGYDYSAHLSEVRSDVFCAETEEFSVTLSCVSREYPYAADGVACPMAQLVEISLVPAKIEAVDYSVYLLGEKVLGGEASFRNATGDWYYSESVDAFPETFVSLRVEWGEEKREITATSVKNEQTLSPLEALGCAVNAERERVERMRPDGAFRGEFHVRLLRRDKNYYYVGIVGDGGSGVSLLLDSETGEVLASKEND